MNTSIIQARFVLPVLPAVQALLYLQLGYKVSRTDSGAVLICYSALFGLYLWSMHILKRSDRLVLTALGIGIGFRALLLFNLPALSDDFYRFLWDGRLIVNGIHPFAHPPRWFVEQGIWPAGLDPALFARLNSPEYYTVYPPVCQGVFALAAWVSPHDWRGGVVCMKLFLWLCEIGSIFLLARGPAPRARKAAMWYALNPLCIVEIVGNCHFEGAAIFFMLAASRALAAGGMQRNYSPVLLACSVACKLWPLLFAPLIARWLGWRQGFRFALVFALSCVLLFLPLLDPSLLKNMSHSLDLYFQKFAFNASLYYVLWEIGLYFKHYNLVNTLGPAVGMVQIICMAWVWWRLKPGASLAQLFGSMLLVMAIYLAGASTVHPWYVCFFWALSLLPVWAQDRPMPYAPALIWTGAVVLSYSHYEGGAFQEQKTLIALEYVLVGLGFLIGYLPKLIGVRSPRHSP